MAAIRTSELDALLRGTNPRDPASCFDLVCHLGPLARWLVRPEILDRIWDWRRTHWQEHERPASLRPISAADLPTEPGGCWPIFVTTDAVHRDVLREAFVLPLRWVRSGDDAGADPLPTSLADEAERVLAAVMDRRPGAPPASTPPASSRPAWSLRWAWSGPAHAGGHAPDALLGGVLACSSAWTALAGGLVSALRGCPVDGGVWASAAWEGRPRAVGGLETKQALAAELGGHVLFAATGDAASTDPSGVERRALVNDPDWPIALRDYLAALIRQPADEAPLSDWGRYHDFVRDTLEDRDLALRIYRDRCIPGIIAMWHQRDEVGPPSPCRLIAVVGLQSTLVELIVRFLRPTACLLLMTGETAKAAAEACAELEATLPADDPRADVRRTALIPRPIRDRFAPDSLATDPEIAAFLDAASDGPLLVDLTGGKKSLSMTVLFGTLRHAPRLIYVDSDYSAGNRVLIGTERLDLYDPATGGLHTLGQPPSIDGAPTGPKPAAT